MAKVTPRDIQEIVTKLSSDKAKTREDGIKLLNTWLEGERSMHFCKYIGQETAMLKPNQIPGSETWPFLITLLIDCVLSEVAGSKRRSPKIMYAKALRIAVQRAEDSKAFGYNLPLIMVVKSLFGHILDVLNEVPSFQSDYGIILRNLLAVRDYRFHMKKRVYCGLVLFHMERIETSMRENYSLANTKEEVFRCILTLHSLLENPPGDFPDTLRDDVVRNFCGIFSFLRDEGKVSRKLIECLNTYLLEDGPNLGCRSLEIHDSVKQFLFRCWPSTHDRNLKAAFIVYSKLQLNLARGEEDEDPLVEQLLDVVGRELNQSNTSSIGAPRADASKEDKLGFLSGYQHDLVGFAALVFYRACLHINKTPLSVKRARREHAISYLKEGLVKGKWLWHAAFCNLLHNYHSRMAKDAWAYWFDGIYSNFERIVSEANAEHAYDGLLWTLRSLQELCFVLMQPASPNTTMLKSSFASNKISLGWQAVWNTLMHGLPILCNVTSVVDAAFTLFGTLILNDIVNITIVPQDVWNLPCFKHVASTSVLYFISCYFSRKGSQGDLRDNLHLRQNILRGVLSFLNLKDSSILDKHVVTLFPAAIYALCAGLTFNLYRCKGHSLSYHVMDDAAADLSKKCMQVDLDSDCWDAQFECFVDVLADISQKSQAEVSWPQNSQGVRLPRQLRDPLLHEMENFILASLAEAKREMKILSEIFFHCAFLCNLIYGSSLTRTREELSPFRAEVLRYLMELVESSVRIIQDIKNDVEVHSSLGSVSFLDGPSTVVDAFKCFVSCSLFDENGHVPVDTEFCSPIVSTVKMLLESLSDLYMECMKCERSLQSDRTTFQLSASSSMDKNSAQLDNSRSRILDVELDVNDDSMDAAVSGRKVSGNTQFRLRWKLDIVSLISVCFSVCPTATWYILFDILNKDCRSKVCGNILRSLCENPHWSSSQLMDLVTVMNEMVELRTSLRLHCFDVLAAACHLLGAMHCSQTWNFSVQGQDLKEKDDEQSMVSLADLVNKVAASNLLDWRGRVKLVDCICDFIRLSPQVGQTMIDKLLISLGDHDYRVRLFLGRRIGVLFQTWDGHDELFQDICSNFGIKLVLFSKERLVAATEVMATGFQPRPAMETVLITLMHIAFYSEKMEMEAVFTICATSAIDSSQRALVKALLDSLSRQLQYTCRSKYLDQLMGCILFGWVACGVSLAALVEIRDIFDLDVEPKHFMQYCSQWLLPALILHGDAINLDWVASITGHPLASLVKKHFVQIFSACMVLHCSNNPAREKGTEVLQSAIVRIADISENERDRLIKKHMVSIISHILGLSSCVPEATAPLFSKEIVEHAVRTVVDGFLDMDGSTTDMGVVDKINVFRPDRVFMLVVEIHYRVTAAINERHKCHRLSGVEVLINVLGRRVAISSTSRYLFNLIGQFLDVPTLQDQCCRMISSLLKTFEKCLSKETIIVFGEQVQYLVPKLVACCIRPDSNGRKTFKQSTKALSLLQLLTIDSDPSLHDYIKELEAFPAMHAFDKIRKFHEELCRAYSPRDHILNIAKRSCYLPPKLLLLSLRALHRKLLSEVPGAEDHMKNVADDHNWHGDHEIARAVWTLVRACGTEDVATVRVLLSDFISRVGIGDPRSVLFHLADSSNSIRNFRPINQNDATEVTIKLSSGLSEDAVLMILRLLKKYLMDDAVKIIDLTSQALHGILATEKGQRALSSFDSHERSIIEVHSKGVNMEQVQLILSELERKARAEATPLEDSSLWITCDKTFEMWICPLVYSLIGYCDDVILRLCQDIALEKAEIAEFLFPSIMVNVAGRKDWICDLCTIVSDQVKQNIFTESNNLTKSIQVLLDALNELRLCHVMERSTSSSTSSTRENVKNPRLSSANSAKCRTSARARDLGSIMNSVESSTSLWDKVYWLPVDYLVTAKSAIVCGSYLTAVMYVEYWCEDHFKCLALGSPDFSHLEVLPHHIDILLSAFTQINEPDSLYGVIQSHKLTSQIITLEHEGNWSKALEYYDLQARTEVIDDASSHSSVEDCQPKHCVKSGDEMNRKPFKGLIRSLQQIGCTHILDLYCQGLVSRKSQFQHDPEFVELQYEAAWRSGNWDFSVLYMGAKPSASRNDPKCNQFNENLHSCLRALQEGDPQEFHSRLSDSKQELVLSVHRASVESTHYIYSTIVRLQILDHLGVAWNLRWNSTFSLLKPCQPKQDIFPEAIIPTMDQLSRLSMQWSCFLKQTKLHTNLLEPFIAFRIVLLQTLGCKGFTAQHLLQAASALRKGSRFSQAASSLHEFKVICSKFVDQETSPYWLGRLEEAKLLRAQGQHQMAINLGKYIAENNQLSEDTANVYRLVGKWLAETRSSNSRTIMEKYLKRAVAIAEDIKHIDQKSAARQCQSYFHLAHYADALFQSHEERLNSSEWQAAMRLRKHKTQELEALFKRLKSSTKWDKTDYSRKIQELQKQLMMDKEEAEKLEDDRDNFLKLALDGYERCLVIGDKYDVRVVFRLISLWFSLSSRQNVVDAMLSTIKEVQSYKFIPLVYQIASRLGGSKEIESSSSFQFAVFSLVKKMAVDHPYHTILQLLALANGDRIKDKQCSRNSFIVDMDKKHAAENLLKELRSYHGPIITQMTQMVEVYINLAELETKREDTNRRLNLPRAIRTIRQLELVPVVTSTFPIDRTCQYKEGSFPHFRGLSDSVVVMNGINAPKVVECYGSDGKTYRQLAKSGNDDLRQDAVMEQFFGLVNTFLQNYGDTWKRKLGVRTYKVVPFTPSAGVIEWVNGTVPLGDYLIGSSRNAGAHGCYGNGDWSFSKCREHMTNAKDKRKAFREVYQNFRPVLHHFFLERFWQPADWFEKRLAYTRSVAASSMLGYIVGLGDRHSMNILIDQASAEVIHIDLGVAFEQGLMLKTPERVPFRLTRDIIDGMGVTGVEGVFRRCCEETLAVMRTNKEALLTIIEVFIHDPLYKWALSPLKALQRQKLTEDDLETSWGDSEDEYEGNKDATRALLRVKQKLDGYEEGELRSVHGQVQQLIQDAIDPERMCQMFPGWAAWM